VIVKNSCTLTACKILSTVRNVDRMGHSEYTIEWECDIPVTEGN